LLYGAGIVANYLKLGSIVRGLTGDAAYRKIYISSQANIGRLISLYYLKRGAEIIYFDDGEGSYDDNKIYEAKGIDRVIRRILFGRKSLRLSEKRKLYCPELFKKTFGDCFELERIPNWAGNAGLLKKINEICGYTDDARIRQKYILLDTIPEESFDQSGQEIYEKLVRICIDTLGEQLIVKKHPRDKRTTEHSCQIYPYGAIPFEVICANSDIQNKVLICSGSSAVLMPKLLFDSEPTVILLHHMTGARLADTDKRETIIRYVKEMYCDQSRFIVPETPEAFAEALNKRIKQEESERV